MKLITERDRSIFLLAGAIIAGLFLMLGMTFVSPESRTATLLFDLSGKLGAFPFTVQALMWLVFFIALADFLFIYLLSERSLNSLHKKYLPEDRSKMISIDTARTIYRTMKTNSSDVEAVPYLVLKTLDQLFSTMSLERANDVFNSSVRILSERIELQFSLMRYIAWLLPTIGFIGTVIGISLALVVAGDPPIEMDGISMREWMSNLTGELGYAFDTTLLALAQSAVIVLAHTQLQARADRVLNQCEEYCLNNLINKLLVDKA